MGKETDRVHDENIFYAKMFAPFFLGFQFHFKSSGKPGTSIGKIKLLKIFTLLRRFKKYLRNFISKLYIFFFFNFNSNNRQIAFCDVTERIFSHAFRLAHFLPT